MRTIRTAILFLALVTAVGSFAGSALVNFRACQPARPTEDWARAWRIGGLPWRDLAVFAEVVRAAVPPGSIVAFRAVPAEHAVAWRIAYLLPDFEIRPVSADSNVDDADYAAVLRGAWSRDDLEALQIHRLGAIYRVAEP